MNSDFENFVKASAVPSEAVSKKILGEVRFQLNPNLFQVLAKFSLIHALSGGTTLLFCPQLGVGPFFGEHGIMAVFMILGPIGCAMACGGFFLGSSFFLSALLLKPEELRRVKNLELVHVTFFASISYGLLMFLGARNESFEFLFWLFGAVLGGFVFFEAGRWLRFRKLLCH